MTDAQRIQNLTVPAGVIDAVLDTDAYNEVDDQFAISLFLRMPERVRPLALYAAPFYNSNSSGPADGMEKSYDELGRLLPLLGREDLPRYRGSDRYLPSETEAVDSPAARDLIARAMPYSPERPLYVVAIGAITNVASALLLAPEIKEKIVVVWLGGHSLDWAHTKEFNMVQDIAAARVVMGCGVPFVQLPCMGVVDAFAISKPELEKWLVGKNPLADYLAKAVLHAQQNSDYVWSRVIWDVTAVAWLFNDGERFMQSKLIPTPLPAYDGLYEHRANAPLCRYVHHISRDALMAELIRRLTEV